MNGMGLTENLTAGSASVYLAVATVCAGVSFIRMARVDTFAEKAAQTEFYNSCALAWYFGVGLLLSVGLYVNSTQQTVHLSVQKQITDQKC